MTRCPTTRRTAGYEGALVCPLTLKDRPDGDPFIGVLVVLRRPAGCSPTRPRRFEILAGQAALAVERVMLTQEVVRQRGEALFRTLVQDASDVILIVGDDRRIRYATPSAADIFGDVAVESSLLANLVGAGHARGRRPRARPDVQRCSARRGRGRRGSTCCRSAARRPRRGDRGARSDLRNDETVGGLVLTLRDVTEQHELEQELKYQAFHDALTGLPNRLLFAREAADGAGVGAQRPAGSRACCSSTSTTSRSSTTRWGTASATSCSPRSPSRLAAAVRATDTAARLGGDEFALLIDDAADAEAVDAFAERIVAAFAEPFTLSESKVITSATVGVATSAGQRRTWTSCCGTRTSPCTRRRRRASGAGGTTTTR